VPGTTYPDAAKRELPLLVATPHSGWRQWFGSASSQAAPSRRPFCCARGHGRPARGPAGPGAAADRIRWGPPTPNSLQSTARTLAKQGVVLTVPRSKTDQEGAGRKIGIPYGRTVHCPVRALDDWPRAAQIEDGAIFRSVDRHRCVSSDRRGGEAVSLIVRDRMSVVGFDSLELFRPQLARRVRDQRHQSRRLHVQDQAADWARFRRHALALHSGWGTSSFGTPPEFFSRHCDGVLTCRHSGRGLRRQPPSSCVGGVADRQLRRRHQAHFAPLILQAKA
jgi:hypothetical protein